MAKPTLQPDLDAIAGWEVYPEHEYTSQEALMRKNQVHPLDQLSMQEISQAVGLIRARAPTEVKFNCVSLREPTKAEYGAFKRRAGRRPDRKAFSIILAKGTPNVTQVVVNLTTSAIETWQEVKDVAPTLTLEDLDIMEISARKDPRVIAVCEEIGITDMSKVFIDGWAIGHDGRWGFEHRLGQGLGYYRNSPTDNMYSHPLDFSLVVDIETEEILAVDVRRVNGERTLPPLASQNYMPEFLSDQYKMDRLKPIDITQPQGVSFKMRGNELTWGGYTMHIGFNYREGIVISDVRMDDPYEKRERTLFNRISVVEMVVPYGNPDPPHHKKHAFDFGEYGGGLMTNSLKLGCDCKGAIHYLDAVLSTSTGLPAIVKNAVCIHEEDNGLLYKHTDYRDASVVSARDRKLIISQIITAANYEYGFYHTFTLDGTYKLEVKLTGLLNTYCIHPTESAAPYGSLVAAGTTAHNHQHLFSLRIDPELDGKENTVVQNDAVLSEAPLGSAENPYGNGFYSKKTVLRTAKEGASEYCHQTSRTWDIINPNVVNPAAKKPIGYKIVNTSCPPMLARPDSIVYKRALFATKALWVTPYRDHELFPSGDYVCQSTGEPGHPLNQFVADWVARDEPIENTDIVCYLQFGLTHFPRCEDYPIMPAEPVSVMLRASNFFQRNPALWVPPSNVAQDRSSRNAFQQGATCCAKKDDSERESHL